MKTSISILLATVAMLVCSCGGEQNKPSEASAPTTSGGFVTSDNYGDTTDTISVVHVDTIRYNVTLIPEEDYEKDNLQYLNRMQLVDAIFNSIYNGAARVYKFRDGAPISIDEIRQTEIEDPMFRRNLVSLLQFTEAWEYDAQRVSFRKRVISVHVAYAIFREGKYVGNRAGLIVMMNN